MKFMKPWISNIELCDTVPEVIPTNEISRVNVSDVALDILCSSFWLSIVVNLFIFVGNWDILTLLVMADIVFFMVVTFSGVNVMYGVMFILVIDLVVCIYVMYL